MAEKSMNKENRNAKDIKKKKNGFFSKVKSFFSGIFVELKRVVWPNKELMKHSIVAVALISLTCALLIFIVDFTMINVLNLAGFNTPVETTVQTTVSTEVTDTEVTEVNETEQDQSSESQTQASESATQSETSTPTSN